MSFVTMAVLGTLLFVVLMVSVPPPSVSSHWERCNDRGSGKPHHYDYSQDCISESTRCGSFCFWAECIECTPWIHYHDHEHCSDDGCWTHVHKHIGHKSPCIRWFWHIFDPDAPKNIGADRSDHFDAPDLITLLEPGGGPMISIPRIPSALPSRVIGRSCRAAKNSVWRTLCWALLFRWSLRESFLFR